MMTTKKILLKNIKNKSNIEKAEGKTPSPRQTLKYKENTLFSCRKLEIQELFDFVGAFK